MAAPERTHPQRHRLRCAGGAPLQGPGYRPGRGCFERMSFRLCDGLSGIAPEEVDALVIAGMGGETITNILEAAPWVKEKDFPIILQPMSTQAELRGWLWRNGFLCLREKTVLEGETLYSIILARQGGAVPMTPAEEWAGRQYPGMGGPGSEACCWTTCWGG